MKVFFSRMAGALRRDAVGGVLLVVAAVVALVWANSPWAEAYEQVRGWRVGPEWAHLRLPLSAWAADGLLALFFFTVGTELKHEFVHGRFRDPRQALVPVVAAVTGAVVPAVLFAVVTGGDRGWGVPMATDAAFAVAVLALVGRYLPMALRALLLTLAVVDDLIAIVVIAVFYADGIAPLPLLGAVALLALFLWAQRFGPVVCVPLAVAVWALVHAAGVHATVAGVALGLLLRDGARAEHLLRPWATGLALPVFALSSAGVAFGDLGSMLGDPVTLGVVAGLVVGKLVGIVGGAWLTTRLTGARLDPELRWIDVVGMSQLAGIGFTVSLLVSGLSYPDSPVALEHAKGGVLLGSLTAALLACTVLGFRNAHHRRRQGEAPSTGP